MLLDKYMKILAKSEEFTRLIFDEEFEGAEAVRVACNSYTETESYSPVIPTRMSNSSKEKGPKLRKGRGKRPKDVP